MKKLLILLLGALLLTGCAGGKIDENPAQPTEDQIHAALEKKIPDWDRDQMKLEFDKTIGNFASGVLTTIDGNSPNFWFAKYDGSEWSIVTYGHYGPYCDQVDPDGVPFEMVWSCVDRDTDEAVKRDRFKVN